MKKHAIFKVVRFSQVAYQTIGFSKGINDLGMKIVTEAVLGVNAPQNRQLFNRESPAKKPIIDNVALPAQRMSN